MTRDAETAVAHLVGQGAASILLRKERSYAEIYNDLDDEVVNLFDVLRHPSLGPLLVQALELTPFARVEFARCYAATVDPVERARRLVVLSFMGFGSNAHAMGGGDRRGRTTGFRSNSSRSGENRFLQTASCFK
jgi:DNA adenine methylase